MFSATKFVVAGAIVALFGGILLAGVLTQPSERSATGVIASSSPAVTHAVQASDPEGPVEDSADPAINTLAGLETRRLGPGVVRIIGDGTGRKLDDLQVLHIATDGSVWGGRDKRVFKLGLPGRSGPMPQTLNWYSFSVSDVGNLRAWSRSRDVALELQDRTWVRVAADRPEVPIPADASTHASLHASDGSWWFGAEDASRSEVLRYEEDQGWTWHPLVDGLGTAVGFVETPDGELWAVDHGHSGGVGASLHRFDGQEWQQVEVIEGGGTYTANGLSLEPDGSLAVEIWSDQLEPSPLVARWDGQEWALTPPPPALDALFPLLEKADDTSAIGEEHEGWAVGEDGRYLVYLDGEKATRIEVPARARSKGVFVRRHQVAPDGSIWLAVWDGGTDPNRLIPDGLYVITPEAVADTE